MSGNQKIEHSSDTRVGASHTSGRCYGDDPPPGRVLRLPVGPLPPIHGPLAHALNEFEHCPKLAKGFASVSAMSS